MVSLIILTACATSHGSRTFHSSAGVAKVYHDCLSDVKQKDRRPPKNSPRSRIGCCTLHLSWRSFLCLSLVFGTYHFNPLGNSTLAAFHEWQDLSLGSFSKWQASDKSDLPRSKSEENRKKSANETFSDNGWLPMIYERIFSFGSYSFTFQCRMWSTKALQKSAKIKALIINTLSEIGLSPNFGEWQTSDKNFAFFGKHLQMKHPLFYLFLCRFLSAIPNPFFFQTGRFPTCHLHKPT